MTAEVEQPEVNKGWKKATLRNVRARVCLKEKKQGEKGRIKRAKSNFKAVGQGF
jgi:hypothetical protein